MKEIAIVTKQMVIGGTEKALLPMLKEFDPTIYHVELYLQELGGALFSELPDYVKVIKMPTYGSLSIEEIIKHPLHLMDYLIHRPGLTERVPHYIQCERSCHCMPRISKEYDAVISYHAPDALPFFYPIHNMRAKMKIAWLHFDIEETNAVNTLARKYFEKYDKIIAVSKRVKEIFDRNYPDLSNRSEVFYNLVDSRLLKEKAMTGLSFTDDYNGIRLLSLGRLTLPKGYDLIIPVIRRLIDEGIKLRFYICGDGDQRHELEDLISIYNLQGDIVLLGMQDNPYRFLEECDIYVQPSRFEGYCTTTNEARVFCKPAVVTDVCGMREQFIDHETGSIVECSEEGLYQGLKELILSKELRSRYTGNLSLIKTDRSIDIDKIFE